LGARDDAPVGTGPRRCWALSALVAATILCLADAHAAPAATAPLAALAARYAPVVQLSEQERPCTGGEPFEPIDVDALFGNDEVALRGPWDGANLVEVARATDLAGGRCGYALDFPGNPLSSSTCSYEVWQRCITTGDRPPVYAHAAVEDGKPALQYWFFSVYNDFNNKHEGDWEVVQLDFEAATPPQRSRRARSRLATASTTALSVRTGAPPRPS
jgi:hypothetical protein